MTRKPVQATPQEAQVPAKSKWRGWADPRHPMHRPAGGGQPRPYRPGNLEAVVHGANSAALVDAVAERYRAAAVAFLGGADHVPDYLGRREYDRAIQAWARAEARVDLVTRYLDDVGHLDDEGNPRPAARHLVDLEAAAAKRRAELGLDPLSRARLGRDVAATGVDLARLWADTKDGES
jgi:hypothetical protein